MVASAAHSPPWEIRSELPGRLRLSWEALRHSPELRRQCNLVLTACHWLHGYRLNGLAGSLCLRFPEARRADLPHLLKEALAPEPSPVPKASARVLQAQPLLLRHGSLCALALGLDLWLGLPALLVNGAAALLTLPLLAHVWRELRERPPRWTELLDVGFSAVLLRQGLGREVLVDHALEDGGDWLQRVSAEERSREQAGLDVLRRLGSQVRVSLEADGDPVPLAAVRVADRLRLRPGLPVFLAMTLVEGGVAVIRPGGRGLWEPRAVKPGDRLEPGWLVVQGVGIGEVLCAFAEDERFQLPHAHTPPPSTNTRGQRLLRLHNQVVEPLLLTLGGVWALGGATERAMAAFQFNPVSDWQTSQAALRLATRADMRLHGLHLAHSRVLVDLARVDCLLISPSCQRRLDRLEPSERRTKAGGAKPGELLLLVAHLRRHLAQGLQDPNQPPLPAPGDSEATAGPAAWRPRRVSCLEKRAGWHLELEDGRQLTVLPRRRANDPGAVERLEIREGTTRLGEVTLQRQPDARWQEARDHLERMGMEVLALEAPETAADDLSWRLDTVTALQDQGRVVAWLGDDLADLAAMTRADVAIGLRLHGSQLLPPDLLDLTVGDDPHWLPRLVAWSREMDRVSRSNLWLIGLTHALSSLATAGLAISPLQTVLLADLPLLLAELNNRRASGRSHPPLNGRS